jgi:uncharacterized Ntn-hydrolase superfamily protein
MLRRGTYSIVARDAQTGEVGAAVQSHWFQTGAIVTWAAAGVGAVCTQSVADPTYGPRLLERLGAGEEPGAALAALVADDPQGNYRQVAVVSASGAVAVHTGADCIAFAGHEHGEGFSVQANMMASPEVWPAMAEAYRGADGPLARRLLAALDAAEGAGGDVRGRQSAAMVVAPATGEPWARTVDLRVDDHPEPLAELRRLIDLNDAYAAATEGDDLSGEHRFDEAGAAYRRAAELAPDSHELLFWSGLATYAAGDEEGGLAAVRRAIEMQPGWAELLPRLQADIAPTAPAVSRALGLR